MIEHRLPAPTLSVTLSDGVATAIDGRRVVPAAPPPKRAHVAYTHPRKGPRVAPEHAAEVAGQPNRIAIDRLRELGYSWSAVAESLGITSAGAKGASSRGIARQRRMRELVRSRR